MHAMRKVRVAWIVMMNVMTSKFMAGMELCSVNFNVPNIKCNIVGLSKQHCQLSFSSA